MATLVSGASNGISILTNTNSNKSGKGGQGGQCC